MGATEDGSDNASKKYYVKGLIQRQAEERRQKALQATEHRLAGLMLLSFFVGFSAFFASSFTTGAVQQFLKITEGVAAVVLLLALVGYLLYNRARNKINKTNH